MNSRRALAYAMATMFAAWCTWYLYSRFDWLATFEILRKADLTWLFGAGGASIIAYFLLRGLRWRAIMPNTASTTPFNRLYVINSIAVGLSIFTPGQVGEALKIELLKRNQGPTRLVGTGMFLVERLADAGIVAVMAVVGLAVHMPYEGLAKAHVVASGIIALLAISVCIALFSKWRGAARELAAPLVTLARSPNALWRVLLLSLASWLLVVSGWWFSLRAVGISLGLFQVSWLVAVVVIAQLASLIPGGIGISDLLTVKLLALFGYDSSTSLAGAVALRVYGLLIIVLALMHLVYWRSSVRCGRRALNTR